MKDVQRPSGRLPLCKSKSLGVPQEQDRHVIALVMAVYSAHSVKIRKDSLRVGRQQLGILTATNNLLSAPLNPPAWISLCNLSARFTQSKSVQTRRRNSLGDRLPTIRFHISRCNNFKT